MTGAFVIAVLAGALVSLRATVLALFVILSVAVFALGAYEALVGAALTRILAKSTAVIFGLQFGYIFGLVLQCIWDWWRTSRHRCPLTMIRKRGSPSA
jgi:uncharacterized membrane protein